MSDLYVIKNNQEFENFIIENEAALIYFSHEECNVCMALKPKITNLIVNNYKKVKIAYCDSIKNPEIAAQNSIFAVPTILIYFDGREFIRKSRNIGIEELNSLIDRPYKMMFPD
ncbi:MAG: thioredoxin family protein [Deltaproteobacteria bacterium]